VFTFRGVENAPGPNYAAARATLEVSKDGVAVAVLHPEKRVYHASQMPMTESAIRYGLTGDLYVALGDPLQGAGWGVRLFHKPFAGWIWAGALLMALGGLLAALDRRYRRIAP
jgi:cytochrome c-type biogenesis protein CcmF